MLGLSLKQRESIALSQPYVTIRVLNLSENEGPSPDPAILKHIFLPFGSWSMDEELHSVTWPRASHSPDIHMGCSGY